MIPVNQPQLDGNERDYLLECIDTGWISSEGPFVDRLESGMAAITGRSYGIAVANGSAALDVAMAALQLEAGDEVILPTFTIISCAASVVRAGAIPVLVDSLPSTWCMDVSQVESRITSKTRAIMAVHIYGLPVDMQPLEALCERYSLALIEDAAEAHGLTYRGQPCGSFGQISTFSFYPNKLITTGEGGMIVTNDTLLASRCRSLRNLCFQESRRFVHEELGWNYRMSNLQAAVGVAQLERLSAHIQRKREIGQYYQAGLAEISEIRLPLESWESNPNLYWVFGIVLNDSCCQSVEDVVHKLKERGIGTRPFFWPMHEQPVFQSLGLFNGEKYPVAESLARRGFYLPSGLGISDAEINYVIDSVRDVFL